jgi:hypothetical protein
MATISDEQRAREALLKCMNERPWLENYLPHIAAAIRDARRAGLEQCVGIARAVRDDYPTGVFPAIDMAAAAGCRLAANRIIQEISALGDD